MDKDLDKTWWRSKKVIVYLATQCVLLGLVAMKAPVAVSEYVAGAVALGLPVLLGVQGWADARGIAALATSKRPEA